MDLIYHRRFTI